MFRKNRKVEVVKPMGEEEFAREESMYRGSGWSVVGGVALGGFAGIGIIDYVSMKFGGIGSSDTVLPVTSTVPTLPSSGIDTVGNMIPVGFAESSMSMLAHVLDPVIDLMVAVSLPIASVIMVGACFFFMLGQNEKAWSTIFNAGLGYILVQLAPMLLDVLKEIGKVV
ncbi:MAG: hypothetical protein ABS939_02390 [Psychrobacillus sp.]